ncbi:MAG TPA: peptidylprolyl isomerase [Steroidobacteraceae bacterium]|nr:peptidylprolyl isomerase [Steroidobacteraceae bacterium]
MIRLQMLLAAMAAAVLAACAPQKTGTDAGAGSVATVDGKAISRNTFEQYAKGVASKPAADLTAQERNTLLDNLVRAQVVAEDAERNGVAAKDETRAALDLSRFQILQQADSQAYLKDRQPSDEELHAEYDLQVAQLDKVQYKISHIQVATEDAAKKLIAQLKAGGNFAQLAKSQSQDANSRDKGGELNWSGPSSMPAPFAAAVQKLKKGETADTPVKTEYGYHVVRLLDTRDAAPPAFDAVKDRLVQIVEQKKFKAYVDSLVAKAKVSKSL